MENCQTVFIIILGADLICIKKPKLKAYYQKEAITTN